MEGPSLVIACEELAPFLKKRIVRAKGTAKLPYEKIQGSYLKKARSWGKHLLLEFPKTALRIHFLMFGSYRIDNPRENRIPKMLLKYESGTVYFYSCAIKELEPGWEKEYDWGIDLMSPRWKPARALKALRERPEAQVADILMDQTVFAGLGNIMKNEILFLLRMHPETKVDALSPARRKALVKAAREYAFKFYEWKKANILKRNWKIMRKKTCPNCGGRVSKRITGKLKRWSHYCPRCQVKA